MLLAIGVVLGLIAASYVTRATQALLFGVAPHDPLTFAGVTLMMTAIGLIACWIPALRAARIDPAIAMRAESRGGADIRAGQPYPGCPALIRSATAGDTRGRRAFPARWR